MTIFRGSGWSFANDPDFMHVSNDAKFWDEMNRRFYEKYHGIDKQHQRWKDVVVAGKVLEGPFGRTWKLEMQRDFRGELKIPWTTLVNYPVQGTGADVMMMARIMAYKRIKARKIPCVFVSTVHDSIVLDTETAYLEQLRDLFDEVFKDIPSQIKKVFGYNWTVPMTCESKYGLNMKNMEKFE